MLEYNNYHFFCENNKYYSQKDATYFVVPAYSKRLPN
jgi:hypothetical protein